MLSVDDSACALTWWADRTGRRPLWGMAIDQMLTMKHALPADASKSARELGLTYTPIRTAIEQVVARQRTR